MVLQEDMVFKELSTRCSQDVPIVHPKAKMCPRQVGGHLGPSFVNMPRPIRNKITRGQERRSQFSNNWNSIKRVIAWSIEVSLLPSQPPTRIHTWTLGGVTLNVRRWNRYSSVSLLVKVTVAVVTPSLKAKNRSAKSFVASAGTCRRCFVPFVRATEKYYSLKKEDTGQQQCERELTEGLQEN